MSRGRVDVNSYAALEFLLPHCTDSADDRAPAFDSSENQGGESS